MKEQNEIGRMIMAQLGEMRSEIRELRRDFGAYKDRSAGETCEMKAQIAGLKVRCGLFGLVAGVVVVIVKAAFAG